MSFAQFNPNFPTLYVDTAWTSATDVKAALLSQWGLDVGSARTFVVNLWEGPKDPDDYAKVTITTGTAVATVDFASQPAVGEFVYVTSITITS